MSARRRRTGRRCYPGPPGLAHLRPLDGLRGVAILLVVLCHYGASYLSAATPTGRVWHAVVYSGWVGVDLFFVLSGFLITRILLRERGRPNYFRSFYARRTLRIFPLYYVVLVAAFAGQGSRRPAGPIGPRLATGPCGSTRPTFGPRSGGGGRTRSAAWRSTTCGR